MDSILEAALKDLTQVSPWLIYTVLFFSAVLQMILPPYPGDTILLLGGCLGSVGLEGGSVPIFISYVVGTILSSYILYLLGLKYGEAVLNFKLVAKYFPQKIQERVKRLIWKYGILIFLLCKFIPGLNSITIIFGGIFKYNPITTLLVVGISSLIHNFIFFIIGKEIGYNLDKINSFLSTYNTVAIIILVCVVGIFGAFKLRNYYRK